jgi:uncharacterized protein HemX
MEALLLSLLVKALPWLVATAGLVALYFGVKQKGKVEERSKWVEKQTEVKAKVEMAESFDKVIDEKVKDELHKIDERKTPPDSDDIFRF